MTTPGSTSGAKCLERLIGSAYKPKAVVLPNLDRRYRNLIKTGLRYFKANGVLYTLKKVSELIRLKQDQVMVNNVSRKYTSSEQLAKVHNIPILSPHSMREQILKDELKLIEPDYIVVASLDYILPVEILQLARIAAINVHPGILPQYRGADPYFWVLANREEQTGCTVHFMTDRVDAGDILGVKTLPIQENDDERRLKEKLGPLGADLLLDCLTGFDLDKIQPIKQDETLANYYPKPDKKTRRRYGL